MVSNLVVFATVYFVLWARLQAEVLKVIKNDNFLVFLAVWGYIPMFLGKLRSGL